MGRNKKKREEPNKPKLHIRQYPKESSQPNSSAKAAKEGFDWDKISDVFKKLDEEVSEFKEAVLSKKNNEVQSEVGDILFTLVNIAKFVKVDAEEALRSTNNKFSKRFRFIEHEIKKNGQTLKETSLEEMERYWQKAKNE